MTDPFVEWAIEVRLNRIRGPLMFIGWIATTIGFVVAAIGLMLIVWTSTAKGPDVFGLQVLITGAVAALAGWWLRVFVRSGEFWSNLK